MKNTKTYILVTLMGGALLYLYFNNPAETEHAILSCPIHSVTGLECPGCGSQRAVHQLLHFNFKAAWALNPLLISSIPYMLLGFFLDYRKPKGQFWINIRKYFFGSIAIYILLILVLLFTIYRNL